MATIIKDIILSHTILEDEKLQVVWDFKMIRDNGLYILYNITTKDYEFWNIYNKIPNHLCFVHGEKLIISNLQGMLEYFIEHINNNDRLIRFSK